MHNNEENIGSIDLIRRKCILEYVKKNPECDKEDVIAHCTETGEGSRATLSKSINDLIIEGILNAGKVKKNSRSYKLTIVSENLLLIIPQDLDNIFSRLKDFTKIIKKKIGNRAVIENKSHSKNIHSKRVEYEAKRSMSFLPYYLTEIINSFYTFYFNFVLPKKIENKNLIIRLYSLYFENLSEIYSFILTQLGDTISYTSDFHALVKSNMYKGYYDDEHPGLYPVYRNVRMCRINGIEEELYNVLDQLWLKNEETCLLLYGLNPESNSQETSSSVDKESNKMFESKYTEYIKNNKILDKIHLLIDYYIYQDEKCEENAEGRSRGSRHI